MSKLKGTDYRIVMVPDRIEFVCPYCEFEDDMGFEKFVDFNTDGYEAWHGNGGVVIECDDCGKEFEFLDSEID